MATISLRERKKAETRDALIREAFTLFSKSGFEAVTVDEIAASALVSRSTFFRYFRDKESVVFPFQAERIERFRDVLFTQVGAESVLDRVRRACDEMSDAFTNRAEMGVLHYRIVEASPVLVAKQLEVDYEWEVAIAEALQRSGVDDWRAKVAAAAIFGALRVTVRYWQASGAVGDLRELGRAAFEVLRQGFDFTPR